MPRKLTSDQARAMGAQRKTHGAGTGRPHSTDARCACGKYTRATAHKRYHACDPDTAIIAQLDSDADSHT